MTIFPQERAHYPAKGKRRKEIPSGWTFLTSDIAAEEKNGPPPAGGKRGKKKKMYCTKWGDLKSSRYRHRKKKTPHIGLFGKRERRRRRRNRHSGGESSPAAFGGKKRNRPLDDRRGEGRRRTHRGDRDLSNGLPNFLKLRRKKKKGGEEKGTTLQIEKQYQKDTFPAGCMGEKRRKNDLGYRVEKKKRNT